MAAHTKQTLWQQIIRYSVAGGAFFWSGYILFAVLEGLFGMSLGPAKILSYLFGLTVNFLLTRWWVFQTHQPKKSLPKVTSRYLLLSAVNLGIDYAIVINLAQVGVSPYIGQFISSGFFTVSNFFLYKYWVFPNKEDGR